MPTAGRLAGAVIFGLFGWYLAGLTIPFFPEANAPTYWLPATSLVSLFIGWTIVGGRAGNGYNPAMGSGLTAGFTIGFVMLFLVAFNQMISNALRLRYDGPMEAVVSVFELMLEFALYFYDFQIILTLFLGGIVCAWGAEFFGKRYP